MIGTTTVPAAVVKFRVIVAVAGKEEKVNELEPAACSTPRNGLVPVPT
jgi:hypothetical protein